jgi:hypothetical protein
MSSVSGRWIRDIEFWFNKFSLCKSLRRFDGTLIDIEGTNEKSCGIFFTLSDKYDYMGKYETMIKIHYAFSLGVSSFEAALSRYDTDI